MEQNFSKRPLIGLTPSHDTANDDISMRPTYLRAITAAGGIPVTLPLEVSDEDLKQLAKTLDGFLFTGGPDPHPFLFGEETHQKCGLASQKRDSLETRLLPFVMAEKKPILGICRGIQIINVTLGGTLYQDIPSQFAGTGAFPLAHTQPFSYAQPSHHVHMTPGSMLAEIFGAETVSVNSMHHQALKDMAPGLVACGFASDGLIEAAEMPSYPFLAAVQWHPEHLFPQDPAMVRLFQAFVKAAVR